MSFRNAGFGQHRPTKTANTDVSCFVVSEGIGWAARLRRAINARLEEMSFRSGVAALTAVLAFTGAGIALAIALGSGHGAAAAISAAPRAVSQPSPIG